MSGRDFQRTSRVRMLDAMKPIRIHIHETCSTCRNALRFLDERGIAHEALSIREQPPTITELRAMLGHLGGEVRRLFNTSGMEYRARALSTKLPTMSVDDALALLAGNGMLVKRPFLLAPGIGLVGFRAAEWERLAR